MFFRLASLELGSDVSERFRGMGGSRHGPTQSHTSSQQISTNLKDHLSGALSLMSGVMSICVTMGVYRALCATICQYVPLYMSLHATKRLYVPRYVTICHKTSPKVSVCI